MILDTSTNFTLSLSGGGALGIAHLGVLHDMQKSALRPTEIIGTSMGAIIGACFAIGMSESEILKKISEFSSISSWLSVDMGGNSIVNSNKISKIFDEIFNQRHMGDTDIPLKIIATNLNSGDKKVFCEADTEILLKDAVLASMAIPGIFSEQRIGNEVYVDGFLVENLGINDASCDDILAVDVLGKNSFGGQIADSAWKIKNITSMFERSMRLIIHNQTRTNIHNSTKNIHLIEPNTQEYNTNQFGKVSQIRDLGLGLLKIQGTVLYSN